MRVIAGAFKGRRLKTPTWDGLRPTSDKLRETLFNILAPRIEGARVLDGYAGTGAVGIEALSRGAAHVLLIEQDRRATALITANIAACAGASVQEQGYTIQTSDVVAALRRLPEPVGPGAGPDPCPDAGFDLILLDPPYDIGNLREVLDAAAARLAPDGLLVLERATRREPDVPPAVERVRDVKSGDSTLTFFRRR